MENHPNLEESKADGSHQLSLTLPPPPPSMARPERQLHKNEASGTEGSEHGLGLLQRR